MADAQGMAGGNPPKEEKKGGGLFVIKSSKPKEAPAPAISPQEISSISGRLRVLEERLYNMQRKAQLTDQNIISGNKKTQREMKDVSDEIKDLRMDMEDLRSVIQQIITEMKKFAAKNELDILKKYVDMWEPLSFMTREQVERLLDEKLGMMK